MNDGLKNFSQPFGPTLRLAAVFTGATGVIVSSYGLGSLTRAGVGDYTLTFAQALPDTNYLVVATAGGATTAYVAQSSSRTTQSFKLNGMLSASNVAADPATVFVLVYTL
jgi:hypothetical protein